MEDEWTAQEKRIIYDEVDTDNFQKIGIRIIYTNGHSKAVMYKGRLFLVRQVSGIGWVLGRQY